jgi:hypothetical protein
MRLERGLRAFALLKSIDCGEHGFALTVAELGKCPAQGMRGCAQYARFAGTGETLGRVVKRMKVVIPASDGLKELIDPLILESVRIGKCVRIKYWFVQPLPGSLLVSV